MARETAREGYGIGETEVSVTKATRTSQAEGTVKPAELEERVVLESFSLTESAAPRMVLIAPWGEVESANGTFVVDEESAVLVTEAHAEHGTDVPIDYEHQSLGGVYASPTGQAPAAGWIRSLHAVAPNEEADGEAGLFAEVEWTAGAREKLAAREYRYLSPVVIVRKRDRRVVALHSAALTNKPAIAGMKPIVNRQADAAESRSDEAVGASGTESVEPADATSEAVEMLRLRLGMDSGSDTETVLVAAGDRLALLTRESAEREARDKVASAMRAGQLTEAQREWAMSLAMKDGGAFEAWLASAPTVVVPGRTEAPSGSGGKSRAVVIASARASFRSDPALALLTSESAWIGQALRESGLE